MSEATIETVETTPETESVETVETANVETVEIPEKTAAEKAAEAIAKFDPEDPTVSMIGAFRKVLADKASVINALVKEIREGGDEIESRIDSIIEDATDTETVEMRDRLDKMRAAVDKLNSELRAKVASENDLTPMTDDVKKTKTDDVSELRSKYNAVKSSSEKALRNMLPDNADISVYFGDLAPVENVSGGSGSGVKKPRLASASVEFKGETTEITSGSGNAHPSFGDVAEFVSKKSGLTNVKDRIKPSEISAVALANDLESGVATFEFTTSEGANVFKIKATTR